jgi:antitoxin MazE
MTSIKFSNIFEVVAANEEEALSLKAQADLIGVIRDLAAENGWSHIEVCAEGNSIMIKQVKSKVNNNRLSEADLLEGLDSHSAYADELFLNVDDELAKALMDQLNELELPFIVRSHKVSQETYGKRNQPFRIKADPDFMTDRKDIVEGAGRFDPD